MCDIETVYIYVVPELDLMKSPKTVLDLQCIGDGNFPLASCRSHLNPEWVVDQTQNQEMSSADQITVDFQMT